MIIGKQWCHYGNRAMLKVGVDAVESKLDRTLPRNIHRKDKKLMLKDHYKMQNCLSQLDLFTTAMKLSFEMVMR